MAYINQWNCSGNVGADAELKKNETTGSEYAEFTLAVKSEGKKDEPPMWVRCQVYGRSAPRAVEFCKKGANVYVTGPLKQKIYNRKTDNTPVIDNRMTITNFTVLRYTPWASNNQEYVAGKDAEMQAGQTVEFDLPF